MMNLPEEYRDAFLCGDCFELLPKIPDESMDLILTDPPYGIDYQSNRRVKREKMPKFHGDKGLAWFPEFVEQAYRILKPDRHFYCFTRFDMYPVFFREISKRFIIKNCLIWVKENHGSGDLHGDYAPGYEMILFGIKGHRCLQGSRASNVLHFKRVSDHIRTHPAEKPIDLLRFLIEKSTMAGEIVLDPFAGTAAIGIACKAGEICGEDLRERMYLMMEINPEWHGRGLRRLTGYRRLMGQK